VAFFLLFFSGSLFYLSAATTSHSEREGLDEIEGRSVAARGGGWGRDMVRARERARRRGVWGEEESVRVGGSEWARERAAGEEWLSLCSLSQWL
jgi:hypothetical protein